MQLIVDKFIHFFSFKLKLQNAKPITVGVTNKFGLFVQFKQKHLFVKVI